MAAVWPNIAVEEGNVFVQISALRTTLDKEQSGRSCIQTVAGRGYRFVAPVTRCAGDMESHTSPGPYERFPLLPPDGAKLPVPLAEARPPEPQPSPISSAERRQLTVMICELVDSATLSSRLDPEDLREVIAAYHRVVAKIVAGFHGFVGKYIGEHIGECILVYFGYPTAQENDAERAVRAALAIQRALSDNNSENVNKGAPEPSVRIGLDCGLVVVDSTGEVFGKVPKVAARVLTAAEPGAVLVTTNVLRQLSGLFVAEERGARELAGVEPVNLFCIVRASSGRRRAAARTLTPFVGRAEELGLLARRWERARSGEGQLVLIVGEPGIGKSRLVEEFRAKLADTSHTWVEWSALQLLQNTPLHPIAESHRTPFHRGRPRRPRDRMVGQGGRPGAAPLGLPGGDRPSRQGDRDGGQHGGCDLAAGAGNTARSSRRLKLQTDYGQAVMWLKGFAAEETKAAFARAAELVERGGTGADLYRVYQGQWDGSWFHGELVLARKLAESFVHGAEVKGHALEAAVAHRTLRRA